MPPRGGPPGPAKQTFYNSLNNGAAKKLIIIFVTVLIPQTKTVIRHAKSVFQHISTEQHRHVIQASSKLP